MLKKANAALALLGILLAAIHAAICAIDGFFAAPHPAGASPLTAALAVAFLAHAMISMGILFFNKSDNSKLYAAHNKQTAEQRIAAIALIALAGVHYAIFSGNGYLKRLFMSGFPVIGVSLLLLATAFTSHVMASVHRALITLGIHHKAILIPLKVLLLAVYGLSVASAVYVYFIG